MGEPVFFDRDISWLCFNERVLEEAARDIVPLMERFNFLAIYSSNLDEFYRVRFPLLVTAELLSEVTNLIYCQLERFGVILTEQLIPALREQHIFLHYNQDFPCEITGRVHAFFDVSVAGFLECSRIKKTKRFSPVNNQLYLFVQLEDKFRKEEMWSVTIPSEAVGRFLIIMQEDVRHIVFLEDIIRSNLGKIFPGQKVNGCYNLKFTREAKLELDEDYSDGSFEKLEAQLKKRDQGLTSRMLYEPGFPAEYIQQLLGQPGLIGASPVGGGRYHNLKDFAQLPVKDPALFYPDWPVQKGPAKPVVSLFEQVAENDLLAHTPYQSFDVVLRFFNEAAIDPAVKEIYTTLYRVASDSRIARALISAAKNGKKVTVVVELKARFDEANNINWSKRMKEAGVILVHSEKALKVHAKIALIKCRHRMRPDLALMATGNLNEKTARFYTDHILLTANASITAELYSLFRYLASDKKQKLSFQHLLVAKFNMQERFLQMIDQEIINARANLPARIIIKVNNLEDETMIRKLYEASNAGVQISLMVRGICRLVPGVPLQSSNISVRRIVDRYLEHGRIFIFSNNNRYEIFMGSADWMSRNLYRRIEVCFPVYKAALKKQILNMIDLQLNDNVQATITDSSMQNLPVPVSGTSLRSQYEIYKMLLSDQQNACYQ